MFRKKGYFLRHFKGRSPKSDIQVRILYAQPGSAVSQWRARSANNTPTFPQVSHLRGCLRVAAFGIWGVYSQSRACGLRSAISILGTPSPRHCSKSHETGSTTPHPAHYRKAQMAVARSMPHPAKGPYRHRGWRTRRGRKTPKFERSARSSVRSLRTAHQ